MNKIKTIETPIGQISMYENDLFYYDMMHTHQYAEQSIIDNELRQYILNSKSILDIGSHVGYHSIAYAKMNSDVKIMSFEPQIKIYELLLKNIEQNGYSNRITAINKCVGHQLGNTTLSIFCDDGPTTSLPLEYGTDNVYNFGGLNIGIGGNDIEMITVDSLNLDFVDYMKVDVEGAEALVLMGAKETILKHKPVICFEYLKSLSPNYVDTLNLENILSSYDVLRSYGYNNFTEIAYQNVIATI
jgi:FkbM family methyltransferase